MEIKQETRAGWCVVSVTGRADAVNAEKMELALDSAVRDNSKVAVDLSNLDYISSAGLRTLLQGARGAQAKSADFVVCSPKPAVKNVFDMSGMHNVIRIQGELPC
jgi:anti-sigma B factor antagonist